MSISPGDVEREKRRLPRGWGRFGKALEHMVDLSEPDEALLSSCVGLNPEFRHRGTPGHDAVALGLAFAEMTKATNVVLGCTNHRLLVVTTGMGGAPREHYVIPYEGLEIASRDKKEFVLRWPAGEVRIRGAAKQQLPEFLDALAGQSRPAAAADDGATQPSS